jgi:hypothetical protein
LERWWQDAELTEPHQELIVALQHVQALPAQPASGKQYFCMAFGQLLERTSKLQTLTHVIMNFMSIKFELEPYNVQAVL